MVVAAVEIAAVAVAAESKKYNFRHPINWDVLFF